MALDIVERARVGEESTSKGGTHEGPPCGGAVYRSARGRKIARGAPKMLDFGPSSIDGPLAWCHIGVQVQKAGETATTLLGEDEVPGEWED